MTVRITKPEFNLREKISELDKPTGLKGSELMRSDTAQDARDLISAGRKNLIINGSMAVAQRGTSVSATSFTTAGYPVCDRWQFRAINTDHADFDISQVTDAPKGVCTKSLKIDVNTAETDGVNADEIFWVAQTIEAQNCSDLGFGDSGASDLTISFYVKSNVTGRYAIYLYSQDPNRYITRTYTIDSSGEWEKKVIHVPGDTAGNAINHDNGIGIKIYWWQFAGSDYKSSDSRTWQNYSNSGIAYGHDVNMGSSTSNYWQLTGVQVERGSNATEFENRSFGEELALCQRYFFRMKPASNYTSYGMGGAYSSTQAVAFMYFPVPMRISPDFSYSGALSTFYDKVGGFNGAGDFTNITKTQTMGTELTGIPHLEVLVTVNSGGTAGNPFILATENTTNTHFDFDAEL